MTVPTWQAKTYGRIGTPATGYNTWAWMTPTPWAINVGQVAIPEFGDIIAPLAIVPIIFFVIRRKRAAREKAEVDSEGKGDGST